MINWSNRELIVLKIWNLFFNFNSQVLNKESEQHEKHQVSLLSQLQEARDSVTSLEQDKQRLLLQLEDALRKLRDVGREEETLGVELRETQRELDESDKKREEIKIKAQETVKQLVQQNAYLPNQ